MALRQVVARTSNILLGVCIPCVRHDASKFKITQLKLDEYFLMYFKEHYELFAHDPNKICKTGDIVLLEELHKKLSKDVMHKVVEVVYPFGNIVDPISGKEVVGTNYRDKMSLIDAAYGEPKNKIDYSKAPKRGWQEGKKDFSHRQAYTKYHEFDKGDKNEIQPYAKALRKK